MIPWYRVSRERAHLAGQSRTVLNPVAEVPIGTDRILSGQTNQRERQPQVLHGYGWDSVEAIAASTGADWDARIFLGDEAQLIEKSELEHFELYP